MIAFYKCSYFCIINKNKWYETFVELYKNWWWFLNLMYFTKSHTWKEIAYHFIILLTCDEDDAQCIHYWGSALCTFSRSQVCALQLLPRRGLLKVISLSSAHVRCNVCASCCLCVAKFSRRLVCTSLSLCEVTFCASLNLCAD